MTPRRRLFRWAGWFALVNTALLALIGLRYLWYYSPLTPSTGGLGVEGDAGPLSLDAHRGPREAPRRPLSARIPNLRLETISPYPKSSGRPARPITPFLRIPLLQRRRGFPAPDDYPSVVPVPPGAVEPDRVIIVSPTGYEIRDRNYRRVPNAALPRDRLRAALQEMRRFYRP